jgi:Reverse transcriptase (RNA-dependent DNA polymerase)
MIKKKEIPLGDHMLDRSLSYKSSRMELFKESSRAPVSEVVAENRVVLTSKSKNSFVLKSIKKSIVKNYKRKESICNWFSFFSSLCNRADKRNRLGCMRQNFLRNRMLRVTVNVLYTYTVMYTKGNECIPLKDVCKKLKVGDKRIGILKAHRVYSKYGVKLMFVVKTADQEEFKRVCLNEKWRLYVPKKKVGFSSLQPSKLDKVCTLNINHLKNKKIDLEVLLRRENPLLMCLQETWITEGYTPKFSGFNGFYQFAQCKNLPGLCTIVNRNDGIGSCLLRSFDNILITAVDFLTEEGWLRICVFNIYVPNGKRWRDAIMLKVIEEIRKVKIKGRFDEIILAGDFNMTGKSLKKYLNNAGLYVELKNNRMKGSRLSSSGALNSRVIDHIVRINTQDGLKCSISKHWKLSDHLMVARRMNFNRTKNCENVFFDRKKLTEHNNFCREFERFLGVRRFDGADIQKVLFKMCLKYGLIRKEKRVHKVSFSRKFERLYKKHNKTVRRAIEFSQCDGLVRNLESIRKQKIVERRKAKERFASRGIALFVARRSREWWKWIKGCVNTSVSASVVAVLHADGTLIYDTNEKLEVWNSHFSKLSSDNVERETYLPSVTEDRIEEISVEELRDAVKNCGNNKATGNDFIPSELLKVLVRKDEINVFMSFILNEYNRLLMGADLVDSWCETDVVALFKKGDINDVNNYRGIALVNTILKLYLKILNDRLTKEVEEKGIISKYQAGFRKGEEGMQHVASLLEIVRRREFDGKDTFMCFVDFEKAYDNVGHNILFKKLQRVGISVYLINALKNLYKKTVMRVKLGENRSIGFEYKKGVRQGCPCSPILFNIFINDILNVIEGVGIPNTGLKVPGLMFADDVVVFGESIDDMKEKIISLCEWSNRNRMKINAAKCGIVVWNCLDNAGTRERFSVHTPYGDIDEVDEYKYLGITIRKRLMEEGIVREAGRKGTTLLGFLKSKLLSKYINPLFKGILIKNVLIPTMMYGKELWGMSSARAGIIRNRVWKAFKLMFGYKNVAYDSVSDELDIERIDIQACKARVRAFKKFRFSKTVISDIIVCPVKNKRTTWSSRSERWITRFLGMSVSDVLNSQLKDLFVHIKEVYIERKSYNRSTSGKLRESLQLGKLNYKYILSDTKTTDVYKFMLLRIGRIAWTNELVARKMIGESYRNRCVLCLEDSMESTFHFVLKCAYLNSIREEFSAQISKLRGISGSDKDLLSLILGRKTSILTFKEERDMNKSMIQMIGKMLKIRSIRVSNEVSMVP